MLALVMLLTLLVSSFLPLLALAERWLKPLFRLQELLLLLAGQLQAVSPMAAIVPQATLLQNGKVLVVGGFRGLNVPVSSSELYDPGTGTWYNGQLRPPPGLSHSHLLQNGKVLITGGVAAGGLTDFNVFNSSELYDPDTGTWSATGGALQHRAGKSDGNAAAQWQSAGGRW